MDRLAPLVFVLIVASSALAEAPRVHFDLPYTVSCRDVSPPEFAVANPGQKLVEAKLEISSLLTAGLERDVTQYLIRIDSPERKLAIVDYLPKTSHESRLAGPLSVQNSKEHTGSLGINFSGKYELISAVGPSAGVGQKNTSCVKYDLLPPLETVAASGTLNRGSAAFFKLKSSPRNLLEGSREFALVLRVPSTWRADYLRIRCEAEGIHRGIVSSLDETIRCGQREFLISVYQEGDEAARQGAENYARQGALDIDTRKSKAEAGKQASNSTRHAQSWNAIR